VSFVLPVHGPTITNSIIQLNTIFGAVLFLAVSVWCIADPVFRRAASETGHSAATRRRSPSAADYEGIALS
jgi:hypothetical protein